MNVTLRLDGFPNGPGSSLRTQIGHHSIKIFFAVEHGCPSMVPHFTLKYNLLCIQELADPDPVILPGPFPLLLCSTLLLFLTDCQVPKGNDLWPQVRYRSVYFCLIWRWTDMSHMSCHQAENSRYVKYRQTASGSWCLTPDRLETVLRNQKNSHFLWGSYSELHQIGRNEGGVK